MKNKEFRIYVIHAHYLFLLFALVAGEIAGFSFGRGIRLTLLDVAAVLLLAGFTLTCKNLRAACRLLSKYFGIFAVVAGASLLWQAGKLPLTELVFSSLYLLRFFLYVQMVAVVALSEKLKKISLLGLWGAGVMIGLLGLVQYFLYPNLRNLSYLGWDPHEFRVFSTFLDPNFTGIILVLTLILTIWFWQSRKYKNTHRGILMIIAFGICLLALFLTYSRGSYAAFLAVLIAWATGSKQWKKALAAMSIFIIAFLFLPRPGGEGVDLLRTLSVYSRIENSREAAVMFSGSPLLGVGFNTVRFRKDELNDIPGTFDVSHSGAGFHNSWLFLLATTGIVGFAAYMWMWWQFLQNTGSKLLLFSFVAVSVHGLFDNSLFFPAVMVWLWVVTGSSIKVGK